MKCGGCAPFLERPKAVLCSAHVLSPPGLLLLCEAVRAGVLADPHGPVRELSGNGFAGTAGAPHALWGGVISGMEWAVQA